MLTLPARAHRWNSAGRSKPPVPRRIPIRRLPSLRLRFRPRRRRITRRTTRVAVPAVEDARLRTRVARPLVVVVEVSRTLARPSTRAAHVLSLDPALLRGARLPLVVARGDRRRTLDRLRREVTGGGRDVTTTARGVLVPFRGHARPRRQRGTVVAARRPRRREEEATVLDRNRRRLEETNPRGTEEVEEEGKRSFILTVRD